MLQMLILSVCLLLSSLVEAKVTQNSKKRHLKIDSIVLHSIGGPYCKKGIVAFSGAPGDAYRWKSFFERHPVLGVHYIIDREGLVLASIDEGYVANHALGWNDRSIGIELVNNGDGEEQLTDLQWNASIELVRRLINRYPLLNAKTVFRHSDIDARTFKCAGVDIKRKRDPGGGFDYNRFLQLLK